VEDQLKKLLDTYPFISFLTYGGSEYLGIIQNCDQFVTNFYDFGRVINSEQRQRYLELGEIWWWESNRKISINLFLKQDWAEFRFCLRTFNSKDVKVLQGPQLDLRNLANKRVKRRQITLIKRV
jgi:hypothetical protein